MASHHSLDQKEWHLYIFPLWCSLNTAVSHDTQGHFILEVGLGFLSW